MMQHRKSFCRSGQRGSVYITTLAILTVLGLITLTLGYTAQTELQASRNTADAIQSRISATTGVPLFDEDAVRDRPTVGFGNVEPGEPARPTFAVRIRVQSDRGNSARRNSGLDRLRGGTIPTIQGRGNNSTFVSRSADDLESTFMVASPLGQSRIEDSSGKININAFTYTARLPQFDEYQPTTTDIFVLPGIPDPSTQMDYIQVGMFFDRVLEESGVTSEVPGWELAKGILDYRYGPDGKPGWALLDDNGNSLIADPGSDGLDNDLDYVIDNIEEKWLSPFYDGIDNNGNGQIDEPSESYETDRLDNDFDGEVDEANEGIDEPSEYSSDIRRPSHGDDRQFTDLLHLTRVEGMTPEIVRALEPYITIFSVSNEGYRISSDESVGRAQINPNTATPEEIYESLVEQFEDLPKEQLAQFTANIIDRRDSDQVPTQFFIPETGQAFFGLEITPFISEVCPDVPSIDESDDSGQFVEIANPFSKAMSLDGWRLEGPGFSVPLSGSIPAQGMLVITDNYDGFANDEFFVGAGSFFDVFRVVQTGPDRRIMEYSALDLPDNRGQLRLINNENEAVDIFDYSDGTFTGALLSFQRSDPRLRSHEKKYATPLDFNVIGSRLTDEQQEGLRIIELMHDQPFRSPLEMFYVSTSFAYDGDEQAGNTQTGWRFASIDYPESDNLDATVADLFMPGAKPLSRSLSALTADLLSGNLMNDLDDLDEGRRSRDAELPRSLYGRININTASAVVLDTITGFGREFAERIVRLREETARGAVSSFSPPRSSSDSNTYLTNGGPMAPERWTSLSDFLTDAELWEDVTEAERTSELFLGSLMITFNSLSFQVTTDSIAVNPGGDGNRRPRSIRTQRIMAADRGKVETVSFRYRTVGEYSDKDVELRGAVPASRTVNIAKILRERKRLADAKRK